MKTILTICLSVTLSLLLFAQEETLMGSGEIEHGGFGAPVIKFTQINGEAGVLVGGRGGWIINHSFIIGGGGYGLVNDVKATSLLFDTKPFINFGYGGAELEFIIKSDQLIHFSVMALLGAGNITYRNRDWEDWQWDWTDLTYKNDQFFVFEPQANVQLNIASFIRIDAGISYRFISGLEYDDLTNSDLAGPSAVLTLRFGKF